MKTQIKKKEPLLCKQAEQFEAFCWMHLLKYLKKPIKDFHRELISLTRFQRVAIAAPRSFAKSSYFSFFYPLYAILEHPGTRVLQVSATSALAEFWINHTRSELENSPSIERFYGNQVGKKWSNDYIMLSNGSEVMAKGTGKQIRGFRPNIIIGDDLETDEMVASKDQRDKFDHWFWTDLIGTLPVDSQMIIVGTILDPDSFLADLINHPRHGWVSKFYQAIKPDGSSLWPEQWPVNKLEDRRKEMGDYCFQQEFQNNPIPPEKRIFKKEWIKYFDKEPDNCLYFTTVDPAIELGSQNDFTAIVTVAVDAHENIYVVDIVHKRMLPSDTIKSIFDVYKRFEPECVGIETIGFQKMLKFEVENQRRKLKLFPRIVELKSEGKRKSLRIEALQPRFQAGTIFIRKHHENLETELLRFPSTRCHDDIIDGLSYCLALIKPARQTAKTVNPLSFQSVWDRMKNRTRTENYWGNHNLRVFDY